MIDRSLLFTKYWKASVDFYEHRNGTVYKDPGYVLITVFEYFLDPAGGGESVYKLKMKNDERAINFLKFSLGQIRIPLKTILTSLILKTPETYPVLTIYGRHLSWKILKDCLPEGQIPAEILKAYSAERTLLADFSISKENGMLIAEFSSTPHFFRSFDWRDHDKRWDDHFEEYTDYGATEIEGDLVFRVGFPPDYKAQMTNFISYVQWEAHYSRSPINFSLLPEDQTLLGISIIEGFGTEVFNDGHNDAIEEEDEVYDEQYPWALLPEEILDIFSQY